MKTNLSPDAELSNRLAEIRDYFCGSNNKIFAQRIEDYPANTSAYCNGAKNANLKILRKVARAFPEVDKTWLVFGEGEMLAHTVNNDTTASNALVNNGVNNGVQKQDVGSGMEEISRLIGIIETKDKKLYDIIESKDRQIADLISMIKVAH